MIGIIDTPSPYASLMEWQEFLAEMKKLDQKDPDVAKAIRDAEAQIAALQNS